MPDAVHVAGESEVNGVLPDLEGNRHDIAVPAEGFRREIGGHIEQAVQPPNSLAVKSTSSWYEVSAVMSNPPGHGVPTRGLDLLNDGLCGRLMEICHDDLHAFLRKAEGCGTADVPRDSSGKSLPAAEDVPKCSRSPTSEEPLVVPIIRNQQSIPLWPW